MMQGTRMHDCPRAAEYVSTPHQQPRPPPVSLPRLVAARRSSTERRHPDAQVGDGEAVQIPRPAARDLLGLRAPQRGELALEPQPRELLDDAPADRVGDLVAARAEDVDCRAGGHEIGLGAGLEADT